MALAFFIADYIQVTDTQEMGRGVCTTKTIEANEIIEVSPVLKMSAEERIFLDKTALHDYIFEWGETQQNCCVAWGLLSIYNHSYQSNCEYFMDFAEQTMSIKTVRKIEAGEELFINYNGDWNNQTPLWFNAQ